MKTLALFAAAVLVILGLVQPDSKRAVLRPVPPSPKTSNDTVNPAPTPSERKPDTDPNTRKLPQPPTPPADVPVPQPSPPANPPERPTSLEPPTTNEIEEKPEIGTPIETRIPNQPSVASTDLYIVKTPKLNVRRTASAKAEKIGELLQGEQVVAAVSLYGNEEDGWIEITARNGTLRGWVKKSLLRAQTIRP